LETASPLETKRILGGSLLKPEISQKGIFYNLGYYTVVFFVGVNYFINDRVDAKPNLRWRRTKHNEQ
jgi:hypothetical protein